MTEQERYLFDLQGYLVIEDALTPGELQELNRLLDEYDIWNQQRSGDPFFDFWRNDDDHISAGPLHRWAEPFQRLIAHPGIVRRLVDLLGPQFRYDHGHAMLMRKGGGPFELHGGLTPYKPAISYEVADGQIRCGLLVVAYSLCDADDTDGGFCALPGSHKSNFACPASFEPLLDPGPWVKPVALKAGAAVIFTEALTHGTLRWRADHERRVLFYRYTPGHIAFEGRYREDGREKSGGMYPQPSQDTKRELTPIERQILEPPYAWERTDTITDEAPR